MASILLIQRSDSNQGSDYIANVFFSDFKFFMTKVANLTCVQLRIGISIQLKIENLDLDNTPQEISQLKNNYFKTLLIVIFNV